MADGHRHRMLGGSDAHCRARPHSEHGNVEGPHLRVRLAGNRDRSGSAWGRGESGCARCCVSIRLHDQAILISNV